MPWERHFDLRLHKGFAVGSTRMRVFADLRNPLDLENTNQIYLETGTGINEEYRIVRKSHAHAAGVGSASRLPA